MPDVIRKAGSTLLGLAKAENVLITQGENGMTLFSETEMPFHLRAMALETYDVTGAGDTVIATVAVAFAAGFNLEQSAALANIAAGHVVQQVGTSIIKLDDLKREFEALLNDQSSETALTFGV